MCLEIQQQPQVSGRRNSSVNFFRVKFRTKCFPKVLRVNLTAVCGNYNTAAIHTVVEQLSFLYWTAECL